MGRIIIVDIPLSDNLFGTHPYLQIVQEVLVDPLDSGVIPPPIELGSVDTHCRLGLGANTITQVINRFCPSVDPLQFKVNLNDQDYADSITPPPTTSCLLCSRPRRN